METGPLEVGVGFLGRMGAGCSAVKGGLGLHLGVGTVPGQVSDESLPLKRSAVDPIPEEQVATAGANRRIEAAPGQGAPACV